MDVKLEIISLFWRYPEQTFTINEIAKQLDGTYSYINRVVLQLIKENIILKKTVGHAFLCSLNKASEKTKAFLLLAEISRKEEYFLKHKNMQLLFKDFIKELPKTAVSIILFGSYAKETFTKESDIDILITTTIKEDIAPVLRKMQKLHGKHISPLLFTIEEFQQRKNETVVTEIIKNHIILQGAEQFLQEVY
ncbi:hypothetical protein COV16_05885 [Candidatus Woesearchaeota archaeon CG10_big_fil_rev_8_21_14_0_10_34_8]|nr:MAG: hypothetical protein COV16_05885 [Candidatus Woesearchaeota archaeon CG10_big_fil_rev_8_21_14_0_10_34_8]